MSNTAILTHEITLADTKHQKSTVVMGHSEPVRIALPIITNGWGICRNWNFCGCKGYRGNGAQACTDCGHGFGAHL